MRDSDAEAENLIQTKAGKAPVRERVQGFY